MNYHALKFQLITRLKKKKKRKVSRDTFLDPSLDVVVDDLDERFLLE